MCASKNEEAAEKSVTKIQPYPQKSSLDSEGCIKQKK
jgi:hypothetical protein